MLQDFAVFPASTRRPRVALLIDGDNISHGQLSAILEHAGLEGDPMIRRVYGNAATANGWLAEPSLQLVHAGTGKNATDMLLCVQAMDIMLGQQADVLVIASSDGDFSHLANGLREKGHRVVGLGQPNAAPRFRAACSHFAVLETLVPEPSAKPAKPRLPTVEDMAVALIKAEGKNASMPLGAFGGRMGATHLVTTASLSEKDWRAWLLARPALFEVDPRGPDAKVHLAKKAQG